MKWVSRQGKRFVFKSVFFNVGILAFLVSVAVPTIVSASSSSSSDPVSWSGFYVGANLGYGWGHANENTQFHGEWLTDGGGDQTFLAPYVGKQLKPKGMLGGIQIGYNYQIHHCLLGMVFGMNYLGQDTSYSSGLVQNPAPPYFNSYSITSSYKLNWLATLRPKLGYAFGHFLPYITGGLAIAGQKFSQDIRQHNLDFDEESSFNKTVYGWTVGAGAEYALTNHWRFMLEYLYVDLPSSSVGSTGIFLGDATNYTATHSVQLNTNIIHTGVIYRF